MPVSRLARAAQPPPRSPDCSPSMASGHSPLPHSGPTYRGPSSRCRSSGKRRAVRGRGSGPADTEPGRTCVRAAVKRSPHLWLPARARSAAVVSSSPTAGRSFLNEVGELQPALQAKLRRVRLGHDSSRRHVRALERPRRRRDQPGLRSGALTTSGSSSSVAVARRFLVKIRRSAPACSSRPCRRSGAGPCRPRLGAVQRRFHGEGWER
jgi:hypothetical protein